MDSLHLHCRLPPPFFRISHLFIQPAIYDDLTVSH